MNPESIQGYILSSERRLRIASSVGEAWLEARSKLIGRFLAELNDRVIGKLKGWKSEPHQEFFVGSEPNYAFWKPTWEGRCFVALDCGSRGRKMAFGIMRELRFKDFKQTCPGLLQAVQKSFPTARTNRWWEAMVPLENPAEDWTKPDSLWRMHTEKGFLTSVASQIIEMAKVSEPFIDRWTKKKTKRSH